MPSSKIITIFCMCLLVMFVYGCNKGTNEVLNTTETANASAHTHDGEAGHEHDDSAEQEHGEQAGHEHGEQGEHIHSEEGEEAGVHLHLDEIHDEVRKGVRLVISFDAEASSFIGTVENTTDKSISRVRVEVHLSNGTELGPTDPIELAAGKIVDVKLSAEGQAFEWWTAHAESGTTEH